MFWGKAMKRICVRDLADTQWQILDSLKFEQLVRFTEQEIPKEDGILMIPGEDLFYYATGRYPRFPVLVFDAKIMPNRMERVSRFSARPAVSYPKSTRSSRATAGFHCLGMGGLQS